MTMTRPTATIPVPTNFPFEWHDPEEAVLFWTADRLHFPTPIPAIMDSFLYHDAINRAEDRDHRKSQRASSGCSSWSKRTAAAVVSFFVPVLRPTPTYQPASSSETRVRVEAL